MTPQATLPTWLKTLLTEQGHMSENGLTRRARIRTHKPCRIPTLTGYDADTAALDTWCDLGQLTTLGESQALLEGRWTYELHGERLHRRDRWTIRTRPAGTTTPVFAQHRCSTPIPATWCVPAAPARPATNSGQECPW